jgi:hypothetical protein
MLSGDLDAPSPLSVLGEAVRIESSDAREGGNHNG